MLYVVYSMRQRVYLSLEKPLWIYWSINQKILMVTQAVWQSHVTI